MHQVLIISDLPGLPLQGHVFKLIYPKTTGRDSLNEDTVYLISEHLVLEGEVVALVVGYYLQSDMK